ncbi:hypothetical protein MRB53_038288 [Persea americana]|nr:hypothetical protein MRB53_038288 [Persea americana]
MAHAIGNPLHQQWQSMTAEDKLRFMDNVARHCKEMTDLEFPAYGSLYLSSNCVDTTQFIPFNNEVYMGPHCGATFWDCSIVQPRFYHNAAPNRGPWLDLVAYANGLVDAGISRLPPTGTEEMPRPKYHGSVLAHLELLESGRSVVERIARDPRVRSAACPTMFHPDLHKRNIFVSKEDPAVVTSIIDWQSTSIEPAFWHTDRTPDFAQAGDEDADATSKLCAKAYGICFEHHVSRLAAPRSMSEAYFRPFRYCHRTWSDGAVAFRHELMETERCWNELGIPSACPIPTPTPEDQTRHLKEYRLFEAAQNLRKDLARLIDVATDGWVSEHDWERANAAQREMYSGMVQAVVDCNDSDSDDPVQTEADLWEIWPYDL